MPASARARRLGAASAGGWNTLLLGLRGSSIEVAYSGQVNPLLLQSSLANAKGCTLTVGAVASGDVPIVVADIAQACVQP